VTRAGRVTVGLFVIGFLSLVTLPPDVTAFYYEPQSTFSFIFHFFSHMLSHANLRHLVGNFIFGFPYMYYAEYRLKSTWKFLGLYVVCGGAALAGQYLASSWSILPTLGVIGSSGAVFGIVGYSLASMRESRWIRIGASSILAWHLYNQATLAWDVANGNSFGGVAFAAHFAGVSCGAALAYLSPIYTFCSAKCSRMLGSK
jgi:membrane associated rhomboid family serine protease